MGGVDGIYAAYIVNSILASRLASTYSIRYNHNHTFVTTPSFPFPFPHPFPTPLPPNPLNPTTKPQCSSQPSLQPPGRSKAKHLSTPESERESAIEHNPPLPARALLNSTTQPSTKHESSRIIPGNFKRMDAYIASQHGHETIKSKTHKKKSTKPSIFFFTLAGKLVGLGYGGDLEHLCVQLPPPKPLRLLVSVSVSVPPLLPHPPSSLRCGFADHASSLLFLVIVALFIPLFPPSPLLHQSPASFPIHQQPHPPITDGV